MECVRAPLVTGRGPQTGSTLTHADPHHPNPTPLPAGRMDVARLLVDNGSDVTRRDKAGRTPLQLVDDPKARAALEAFAAAAAAAAPANGAATAAGVK